MSTAGGGDQVKERTVELCATPLTEWGDDDGATTKEIGEFFFPHYNYNCANIYLPEES